MLVIMIVTMGTLMMRITMMVCNAGDNDCDDDEEVNIFIFLDIEIIKLIILILSWIYNIHLCMYVVGCC